MEMKRVSMEMKGVLLGIKGINVKKGIGKDMDVYKR